ncbi:MAG: hypothetical protein J1F18_03505 [Lachnospiraceae bacterium]|nr:hypothetical protein [Lachnospiraceae bacterium]
MKRMIEILCPIILVAAFFFLWQKNKVQSVQIEQLRSIQEQMEEQMSQYKSDYASLQIQIQDYTDSNIELKEHIQARQQDADGELFYGIWHVYGYYLADVEALQECNSRVEIQSNYIKVNDNYIIEKPIYHIEIYRGTPQPKTWNVLQTNYFILKDKYAGDSCGGLSIKFDDGDVQDISVEECDFLLEARYYLMNDNELACITENDGGKIYLLERITG